MASTSTKEISSQNGVENCSPVPLKYEEVQLLTIEGDRVMHKEVILKNLGRVRDVAVGPDGAIYVVLNGPDMVVRLTPESLRN